MTLKWALLVKAESCRAEVPCQVKEEEEEEKKAIIGEGGFSWGLWAHHLWILIGATFGLNGWETSENLRSEQAQS